MSTSGFISMKNVLRSVRTGKIDIAVIILYTDGLLSFLPQLEQYP